MLLGAYRPGRVCPSVKVLLEEYAVSPFPAAVEKVEERSALDVRWYLQIQRFEYRWQDIHAGQQGRYLASAAPAAGSDFTASA